VRTDGGGAPRARAPSSALSVFEFGDFRFDADTPVLWRGGRVVPVTPKALELLRALVERGGDVVSKAELMCRVWPDTVVEEGSLTVLVAALRKALDPRADGGSYVQTVPRRGYRFDASLRAPAGAGRLALAALPFTFLGAEHDPALGLALADAVIGRLAREPGVLVRPTIAVSQYGREPRAPREIAAELGVDALLIGTLQRHGARTRVSVQLVPRAQAVKFFAWTLDLVAADPFALQDAVAEEVVRRLRPRLQEEGTGSGPARPGRREAQEEYLRGRFFWARFTPHALGKAFAHFGAAAALDPRQAAPYAGLADCHLLLGVAGLSAPAQAWARVLECVAQALERDPDHGEAHATRAYARLFLEHDWGGARADLERAVALAPNAASVHFWRGLYFGLCGDMPAGRRDVARGREIDSLSIVGKAFECFLHEIAGEFEEALGPAGRAVQLRPESFLGYRCLGLAYLRTGNEEPALRALRKAVELTGEGPAMRALLARAQAETGARRDARRELAALDALSSATFVSPCARAAVRVALGDLKRALDLLEQGVEERDALALFIRCDPGFEALRGQARYRALLSRVGFPVPEARA
jgi:DNA-binding winged helix-turn-helix (wHTH) protein/tetratricopeptide (TPR) repeat protein